MTTEPLNLYRANRALLKNIVGLLLILGAVAAACTAAWFTDWRLGLGLTAVPVGYSGWLLATSED